MPRTTDQNQRIREESRARIVTSALAVFASYGYERASVRMIAQEAGIAQGLLYSYFASKDDLLRAIFSEGLADIEESFAMAATGETPSERLERLLRGSFAILARERPFWTLFYNVRWQPFVAATLEKELQTWTQHILSVLRAILADIRSPNPDVEATILFGLIDGLGQQFVMRPDAFDVDAIVSTIMERWTGTASV